MFNNLMHPRNIYRSPPNFSELAERFPEFGRFLTKKGGIDFKDACALRTLTTILLKKDFKLTVDMPHDCLIPTVPQRLNYILWIEDLVQKLPVSISSLKGIDVGTGPCCIFPLLGATKNNWHFLATEVQSDSMNWAQKNVQTNNLEDKITVVKVEKNIVLQGLSPLESDSFDFCMCNPPFFANFEQLQRKRKWVQDSRKQEVLVDGGEVAFVKRMIHESCLLKERIKIYSSMLGRKDSLIHLLKYLKSIENIKYTSTEFGQGNTVRWGIAWTFLQLPSFSMEKMQKSKLKNSTTPYSFVIPFPSEFCEIVDGLKVIFDELKIQYKLISVENPSAHLKITAYENTWIHQRRKKRQQKQAQQSISAESQQPGESSGQISMETSKETKVSKPAISNSNCGPIEQKGPENKEKVEELILDCDVYLDDNDKDGINVQFECSTPYRQTVYQLFYLISKKFNKT